MQCGKILGAGVFLCNFRSSCLIQLNPHPPRPRPWLHQCFSVSFEWKKMYYLLLLNKCSHYQNIFLIKLYVSTQKYICEKKPNDMLKCFENASKHNASHELQLRQYLLKWLSEQHKNHLFLLSRSVGEQELRLLRNSNGCTMAALSTYQQYILKKLAKRNGVSHQKKKIKNER